MEAFILSDEERWDARKHVEHILGEVGGGDYTIACWSRDRSVRTIRIPTAPRSICACLATEP